MRTGLYVPGAPSIGRKFRAILGGVSSAVTPPNAVTLTAFPTSGGATAGVQRGIGLTTGSPSFVGTYSGGTPTGFQGRVRKVSDNSVVTDWTDLTSLTFGSGAFSGKLAGVPQGDGYYRDVRPKNATGVTATSSTPFLIGIGVIMYGQSNMTFMSSTNSGSPAAASAGTTYFDGTNFIDVPTADGVRNMLNGLRATSGVPCFALNGAIPSRSILSLSSPGDGSYAALMTKIANSGGDMEAIAWNQGEEEANGFAPTFHWTHVSYIDALHGQLCASLGRTRTQLPMVLGNLSTVSDPAPDFSGWGNTKRAIRLCDNPALGRYFSHTHEDLPNDGLHLTGAGYALAGKRFGQTISYALGYAASDAALFISGITPINSTTVDVTIAHKLGTDFTPTSGITGFEVSEDGGKTWLSCTGARTSAATIRLTHTAVTRDRVLMYARGKLPNMSNPVRDNSAITTGLCGTPIPLQVDTAGKPFADFVARININPSAGWLNYSGSIDVGPGFTGRRFIMVGVYPADAATISSADFLVNSAAAVVHYNPATSSPTVNVDGFVASIKNETDAVLNFSITFSAGFFSSLFFDLYVIDENTLTTKTAPIANAFADGAASTTISTTINTSDGGVIMAMSSNNNTAGGNPVDISGSTVTEPYLSTSGGGHVWRGEVGNNTPAETPATILSTYTTAGGVGIITTHWR